MSEIIHNHLPRWELKGAANTTLDISHSKGKIEQAYRSMSGIRTVFQIEPSGKKWKLYHTEN